MRNLGNQAIFKKSFEDKIEKGSKGSSEFPGAFILGLFESPIFS
jgi:hypothetical protein